MNLYFTTLISTILNFQMTIAVINDYSMEELFTIADTNKDGTVNLDEILQVGFNKHIITVKGIEECSCFHCDGTSFPEAKVCDTYENSQCGSDINGKNKCYTTNNLKCKCNHFSKNPSMCKIPLTHSFVNFKDTFIKYTPNIPDEKNDKKNVNINMIDRSKSYHSVDNSHSVADDMVEFVANVIVYDAVASLFVDTLTDKDF